MFCVIICGEFRASRAIFREAEAEVDCINVCLNVKSCESFLSYCFMGESMTLEGFFLNWIDGSCTSRNILSEEVKDEEGREQKSETSFGTSLDPLDLEEEEGKGNCSGFHLDASTSENNTSE